ncbi:MAG: 5-formyltetrahydrofolate cyclo-ligase [Desulfosarcina sp.]|nr:5-formyltetrahydrofolate cyclo-ligase [Desulfosarcina sp.]MBC2743379.1 5-formyltetrahydrofolate cyclo-ligase [Desulfosarcina sp.]MBC2766289.1 5-formyltetrahydrofolate cyclo-ligase [Desulfosarcina sp.]
MAMDEVREKKQEIRNEISTFINSLSSEVLEENTRIIENRLFEFANLLESKIVMLYVNAENEVATDTIIKRAYEFNKIVVLPAFNTAKSTMKLMKVDNPDKDLVAGPRGILEPNPAKCKAVPLDCIDIAIVPGIAMDEKGGRIGSGDGYYDRIIPDLPMTTRKVGLVFEGQLIPQVPMEFHDKHVDIIITEKRVIYKI